MDPIHELSYPWLDAEDTHEISCCICDGKNPQIQKSAFTINGKLFSIMQCSADEIMYLSPQPGPRYSETLYNHPTYLRGTDDMYGVSADDKKAAEIASIRIKEIRNYEPDAKSLLEIGCAHGQVLEEALKNSFSRVRGIEFSGEAVKFCKRKNLDVSLGNINLFRAGSELGHFDVVATYSVLEHLENPISFLKKTKGLISSNGILVVRIPDTDPSEGPILSLVDHLWHFTRASIGLALKESGFKILDIYPSGVFRGIQHAGSLKSMTVVARPLESWAVRRKIKS